MSQTISIDIDSKYTTLIQNNPQIKNIAWEFFSEYLEELNQDMMTKKTLENNSYDRGLNTKISQELWIS